jgi:type III secretion system FlhB-like substrate exporter
MEQQIIPRYIMLNTKFGVVHITGETGLINELSVTDLESPFPDALAKAMETVTSLIYEQTGEMPTIHITLEP